MVAFKLFAKASWCRRLEIKCAIILPIIVDVEYILIASFLLLFMVGFVFSCCLIGLLKRDFGDELITLIGAG